MLFAKKFRRHKNRSSCNFDLAMFSHHRETKINNFNLVELIDKNVLSFDVSMGNFHLMKIAECLGYLSDNGPDGGIR